MGKSKEVTQEHIKHIRDIFSGRKTLQEVKISVANAKEYLDKNVQKSGLFSFATKIMNGSNVEYQEENILACSLFNELNHQNLSESNENNEAKIDILGNTHNQEV